MPAATTETTNRTWGQRIRRIRRDREITQVELARIVGVDQTRISQWETGKSAITDVAKVRISAALGVPPEDLFPWDEVEAG